jgi:hypothetical protein
VSIFLIVISAAGEERLQTVWRVCFGVGILLPLTIFVFRLRMLSSEMALLNVRISLTWHVITCFHFYP